MELNQNIHMHITDVVKKKIIPLQIVLPSHYAKIYSQEAANNDVELHPDELLNSEMLSEKVVHHVITLSSCTERAIIAIENEDSKLLQDVLEETKQLRHEIDELRKVVYEDALTKSYTRRWFEDSYLANDKTTISQKGTLVVIDVNKFKNINDTYGHIVGDKVLIYLAHKLKELGGNVVRYGGDEFLVLFDDEQSLGFIKKKLSDLVQKFEQISFKIDTTSFKINFAYGIAPFVKGTLFHSVVDTADKEMYRNKTR